MATSRHVTVLVWPVSEMVEPESGFHNRIEPSSLPVITNSESADTCMHAISERSSRMIESVAMSYLRMGGCEREGVNGGCGWEGIEWEGEWEGVDGGCEWEGMMGGCGWEGIEWEGVNGRCEW
jgi:hypothetical protein